MHVFQGGLSGLSWRWLIGGRSPRLSDTPRSIDHRIKAVATVSCADIGAQFRTGEDGKQDPAILNGMLDAAAAARTAEAGGEGVGVFPIFPATDDQARV